MNIDYLEYQDKHGIDINISSYNYANYWLHQFKKNKKLPESKVKFWYREPGLWLPLSCVVTFVNNVKVAGTGASANVNMLAANGVGGLFVAIIGAFSIGTPSDNSGNTWIPLISHLGSAGGDLQFFYVLNPVATATHNFTNGASSFGGMCVLGFSGVGSFDKETTGTDSPATQPGSLTPTTDGTSLFIAGLGGGTSDTFSGISSPFTLVDTLPLSAGVNYSAASAYYIQTSAGAQNPTFTVNGSDACCMAIFAPSGGVGVTVKQLAALGVG